MMPMFGKRTIRKRNASAMGAFGAAMLAVAVLFLAASASDARAARILVLHSYHQGLPWTDGFQAGISGALSRSRNNIELDIHYLDAARLKGAVGTARIETLIAEHKSHAPQDRKGYDVVITTDNDALDMVLRHRESFAPGVPIVFCGINNFSPSTISGHENVTGVAEKLSISDTLELAARLRPQTGKVLVLAEDDAVSMYAARKILEKEGHAVSPAFNGREALDILREGEFDLVIMDVQMPAMDGLQTTVLIRGDETLGAKARIPVIAMTAYAMSGDREKFITAGMDGYVAKPLDRKTLCETIASVLDAAGKSGRGEDVRERSEKS